MTRQSMNRAQAPFVANIAEQTEVSSALGLVTTPSFADLAAMLTAPEVAGAAAPNLDSSMRLAPDDLTDHANRIAEARALAVLKAAAVVSAAGAVATAHAKLGEGVDPGWYSIEDDAWDLADEAPADIETHRMEALAAAAEEDPDDEDPDARVAINAAHQLALELHALLVRLREVEPDLERDDLRELVDEAQTIEGAKQAEARMRARFDVAAALRRSVDAYGRALHEHLAGWPEEERADEEERVREVVFGE